MIEVDILICEALGIEMTDLIKSPNLRISENPKLKEYKDRLENEEPLAYITGHQPFMGLDFIVDKNVLIPRPETELLVEQLLNFLISESPNPQTQGPQYPNILEIGTGSGCIAVTLAKQFPQAKITATDISTEALQIAKKNAEMNSVSNIRFKAGNLFEPVRSEKFDMIVSNPPYVPSNEIDNRYEPRLALDGGEKGLSIIENLVLEAEEYLELGGILAFEFGFGQAEPVKDLLKASGFRNIKVIDDYANIPRMAIASV